MRLINASSLAFAEFFGDDIPKYGILSHTWGKDEVSYQNMLNTPILQLAEWAGYKKIVKCCSAAERKGLAYVWIDTCCIDKTSSAELTEAINSMFQAYKNASLCWAHLADVTDVSDIPNSRWFRRGWTLQELLAPKEILFLDADWKTLGPKPDLLAQISEASGIEWQYLEDHQKACAAVKMSWASGRQTTRVEDIAYCLMGLFDVNMPLLYGEGPKAFIRLQHEIVKISDDESIFAWTDKELGRAGMFARSPAAFASSGDCLTTLQTPYVDRPPYSVSNKGLAIEMRVRAEFGHRLSNSVKFLTPLRCWRQGEEHPLAVEMARMTSTEFVRSSPAKLYHADVIERKQRLLGYIRPFYTSVDDMKREKLLFLFSPTWRHDPRLNLLDTSFDCDEPQIYGSNKPYSSSYNEHDFLTVSLKNERYVGLLLEIRGPSSPSPGSRKTLHPSRFIIIISASQHSPPKVHISHSNARMGDSERASTKDYHPNSVDSAMQWYGRRFFDPGLDAYMAAGGPPPYNLRVNFVNFSVANQLTYHVQITFSMTER